MLNNIRYIERMVSENFGDSFHDLENTDYWELLKILNAKKDKEDGSQSQSNKPSRMNAYDYLMHHAI